jgi:hypothetical protein
MLFIGCVFVCILCCTLYALLYVSQTFFRLFSQPVAYQCYAMHIIRMRKDTQINIRIETSLMESLKKLAETEVTTPSQIVRKALTMYLRKHAGE